MPSPLLIRGARPQARPMTTSESDLTESPCPSEWQSRSLARLVAHLSEQYRTPAELCLDALSDLFFRPRWIGKPSEPIYEGAIEAFTTVEQLVRAHMALEDNLLIPLVLAIEHPELVSVRRLRGECEELVAKALDDHQRIERSIEMLERGIRPLVMVALFQPQEQRLVLDDVATLALLLREQIALEDKCLWPRAMELFRALD
jgi:iron-sulfur cluster repair protein YtfE (RIC family)